MELDLAIKFRAFTATQSAHVLQKFILDVKCKVQLRGSGGRGSVGGREKSRDGAGITSTLILCFMTYTCAAFILLYKHYAEQSGN